MWSFPGRERAICLLARVWLLCAAAVVAISPAGARVPECGLTASATGLQHPLICRAFAADGSELAWTDLVGRLATVPHVLLGEVHDNADHHRIRAQMILALASRWGPQSRSAVVFEHIGIDQELALTAFRALDLNRRPEPAELFAALVWEKSGWPAEALFRPLFAAALDVEWPILPGNASKQDVRSVARGGLATLQPGERERLGLGVPLPAAGQSALLDELEASHCGLMPRTAFGGMADAQRYRDAQMARALVDAASVHGRSLLMAGNGHLHKERGVPWHLTRMAPDKSVLSVLHLEVVDGKDMAADYLARTTDDRPSADFMILTPRAPRPDPCVEMRKRFSR